MCFGYFVPDGDLPGLVAMDTVTELASGSSLNTVRCNCDVPMYTFTPTQECITHGKICKHWQTTTQAAHTHTCIPALNRYRHANMHVYTHRLRWRGVMDDVYYVTWISVASVKAAARGHASTEHAAGMPYSWCTYKMTTDSDTHACTHTLKNRHTLCQIRRMKSAEMTCFDWNKLMLLCDLLTQIPLHSFIFVTLWGPRSYSLA